MKEKNYCDNLYVACPVFESEFEEEPYVQYESFGKVRHTIIVNPKRVLIYSKTGEDGNVRYYRYKTGEEVRETSFKSSFYTRSSPCMNVYSSYMHGLTNLPIADLRDSCHRYFEGKTKAVGYFIPFSEFMEGKLGICFETVSPALASKLVTLTNLTSSRKKFALSQDEQKAKQQLEKIGYHISREKVFSHTSKK